MAERGEHRELVVEETVTVTRTVSVRYERGRRPAASSWRALLPNPANVRDNLFSNVLWVGIMPLLVMLAAWAGLAATVH